MLNDLKIDELLGKVDSRYGLVVSSAKRARQINEYTSTLGLNDALGIPGPQVHTRSQHPLTIAIEELRQDKLEVSFKEPPEEVEGGVRVFGLRPLLEDRLLEGVGCLLRPDPPDDEQGDARDDHGRRGATKHVTSVTRWRPTTHLPRSGSRTPAARGRALVACRAPSRT